MGLSLVTAPAAEPISATEAKAHCRVDHSLDDTLIGTLITAARQRIETWQRRQLVTATWDWKLDDFPRDGDRTFYVPLPPLQSITSITYVDADGNSQTLSSSVYTVDAVSEPGRIVEAYGQSWPATRKQPNAVTVRFVAGYGLAAAVPEATKAALKLLVGHWFANREAVQPGTLTELPLAVERLLDVGDWGDYR
jgi:uncharacterized phiE125 gp8 family phage protein